MQTKRKTQGNRKMANAPTPAPSKPTQLVIPEFMRGDAGRGLENMDSSDIETPRLLLLHAVSPQVNDYENARPGTYWHNMINEPVGDAKNGFEGVILYVDKRAILWRPRPPIDTGGILARSDDLRVWNPSNATFTVKAAGGGTIEYRTKRSVTESRLLEWGTADPNNPTSGPAATLMINTVLIFPEYPHIPPAVFTFSRSSEPLGRKLMGQVNGSGAPIFGIRFRFRSELVDKGGYKFYMPVFRQAGYVEGKEDYAHYKTLHEALSRSGLKMREEAPDDGEVNGRATSDHQPDNPDF